MSLFYRKKWHSLCSENRRSEIWKERKEIWRKREVAGLVNKTTLSNAEKIELAKEKLRWGKEDQELRIEATKGKWIYYPKFPRLALLLTNIKNWG